LEAVILPPTEARRENLAKAWAPPVRAAQAFSSDPPLGFASRRMTVSLTLAVLLLSVGLTARAQTFGVYSIPAHHKLKELIVGFELHITSGRVAQIPDVPIGWNVSVDNDPSWNTAVTGSLIVGAAALGPRFFRGFLVIEKNESLGIPFDVQGEIVVTTDFTTERRIKITAKDLVMKKVATKGGSVGTSALIQ
jgi:hypothetical protein